jgi:hypothetical protein
MVAGRCFVGDMAAVAGLLIVEARAALFALSKVAVATSRPRSGADDLIPVAVAARARGPKDCVVELTVVAGAAFPNTSLSNETGEIWGSLSAAMLALVLVEPFAAKGAAEERQRVVISDISRFPANSIDICFLTLRCSSLWQCIAV